MAAPNPRTLGTLTQLKTDTASQTDQVLIAKPVLLHAFDLQHDSGSDATDVTLTLKNGVGDQLAFTISAGAAGNTAGRVTFTKPLFVIEELRYTLTFTGGITPSATSYVEYEDMDELIRALND